MAARSAIRGAFRRFVASVHGNVAIIFALSLPVLVGATGLGAETAYWYYASLHLQSAADASAYAGELEKLSGSNDEEIAAAAGTVADSNGFNAAQGSIEVNTPPASGPNVGAHAVEVILNQNVPRLFSAIFSE